MKGRHRKVASWALMGLAAVFTAGEAAIGAGISLPGADSIPPVWRVVGIMVITGGAFVLRIVAQRAEDRDAG